MKFDLKRPCRDCPFRADAEPFPLDQSRVIEIADALRRGSSFTCHKTLGDEDDDGVPYRTGREQHCAGALRVMEQDPHGPGQMARIAQRIGLYNPDQLDTSVPVYDDLDAWEEALTEGEEA